MRLPVAASLFACFVSVATASAQSANGFDKSYPVHGRPMLQISVDNVSVQTESCGSCGSVHIRLDMHDAKLSDYKLEELQSGNTVHFTLKEKESNWGWHSGVHRGPEVYVQSPAGSDATIRSTNGSLAVAGLQGNLEIRSENGSVRISDTAGTLRAETTNGSLHVQHVAGSMRLTTSNGTLNGDARVDALQVATDNGSVHLALLEGSNLRQDGSLKAGNGSVELRVPSSFRANLEADSGLGSIHCDLPLGNKGDDAERHHLHGSLNGGGPNLHINTGNGSIAVRGL